MTPRSRLLAAVLRRVTDPNLADAIVGDLLEERARRAPESSVRAAFWFWRAGLATLVVAAAMAFRQRLADGRVVGGGGASWHSDVRQAARALVRAPWYATTAIGVAALSLALAATVFAIVDGVLFSPMPYARPGELYYVGGWFRALPPDFYMTGASLADVAAWSDAVPEVHFAAISLGDIAPIADNDYLRTAEVGRSCLDVLGVRPLLGGLGDDDYGAKQRVQPALLLYDTWQTRFGGDPAIVGRALLSSAGEGLRVAGVLPREFVFPADIGQFRPEAVTPLPSTVAPSLREPTARWLTVIARLPPGARAGDVADRLIQATARVAAQFPVLPDDPTISATRRITRGPYDMVRLVGLGDWLTERTAPVSRAIFATAAALLLLASLNLAGLAAGRALDRRGELGVRRALGSSAWRILRLIAAEHALVLVAGAVVGLLLSRWSIALAVSLTPEGLLSFKAPALDWRVVAFAVAAAAASLVIVTAWSAQAAMAAASRSAIAESAAATARLRSRRRALLLGAQIAIALVVGVGGALVSTSFVALNRIDPGFDADDAARVRVNAGRDITWTGVSEVVRLLQHVPGVAAAGAAGGAFLERAVAGSSFDLPPGVVPEGDVEAYAVTSGVLDTLALPVLEGRRPESENWDRGGHVVLISRTVANICWPGRSAIGRVLTRNGVAFEVAGVVPDVRHVSLDRASAGEIYWPLFAADRPGLSNLFVRFDRESAGQGLDRVLRALARDAPTIHVVRAETLGAALDRSVRQREFQAWLFGAFGVAALAIVGVGLLGSVGMMVARRTREIGIRMALGAGKSSIVQLVLVEQMATVALGLAVGIAVSLWIVKLLEPYLYDITSYDWRAWTIAVAALLGVTALAALVPARRAARVNPVSAISDRR